MSAVASSSAAAIDSNSSNSLICNNPPKRRSGTFRVLADDYSQFTLCDEFDSDFHQVLKDCERYMIGSSLDPMLDKPLIDRSNNTNDCLHEKISKDVLRGKYRSHREKEISRLTDEVEIDGDSASDELDLLPPLPPHSGSKRKFPKLNVKLPNWLLCRNSRIPMKCIIM